MFFHNKDRKTKPDEYKLTHSTYYIIIGISARKQLEQNNPIYLSTKNHTNYIKSCNCITQNEQITMKWISVLLRQLFPIMSTFWVLQKGN